MRLDGSGSVQPDRTTENGGIAASVFVLAVGTGAAFDPLRRCHRQL
jgi:hypothetical protein